MAPSKVNYQIVLSSANVNNNKVNKDMQLFMYSFASVSEAPPSSQLGKLNSLYEGF